MAQLVDHRSRLLVARGRVPEDELLRHGLARADLRGLLRCQGVADLDDVLFAIFEQRGHVSVIRRGAVAAREEPDLLRDVLPPAAIGGQPPEPAR